MQQWQCQRCNRVKPVDRIDVWILRGPTVERCCDASTTPAYGGWEESVLTPRFVARRAHAPSWCAMGSMPRARLRSSVPRRRGESRPDARLFLKRQKAESLPADGCQPESTLCDGGLFVGRERGA